MSRLAVAATIVLATALGGLAIRARGGQTYATGEMEVAMVRAPGTQTVHADTDGVLLPGGRAALVLSVENTTSRTLVLRAVSQAGTAAVVDGGCTVDTAMITVFNMQRLTMVVPPGTSRLRLDNAVYMDRHVGDPCTGGVFRIPVDITVTG